MESFSNSSFQQDVWAERRNAQRGTVQLEHGTGTVRPRRNHERERPQIEPPERTFCPIGRVSCLSHEDETLEERAVNGRADQKLLYEPPTKPIIREQLVTDVKGIYAGLVVVEWKCIEVEKSKNDTTKRSLSPYQWQTPVAYHRTLLHEHHDFFLASQHPAFSWSLGQFAASYMTWVHWWIHAIHSFLEILRHQIPAPPGQMLAFIYLAYTMMGEACCRSLNTIYCSVQDSILRLLDGVVDIVTRAGEDAWETGRLWSRHPGLEEEETDSCRGKYQIRSPFRRMLLLLDAWPTTDRQHILDEELVDKGSEISLGTAMVSTCVSSTLEDYLCMAAIKVR